MGLKITPKITDRMPEITTSFQPLFIKQDRYPKDVFQKDFPYIAQEKQNILYKFASIREALNRPFADFHIDILNIFPLQKLINIYPTTKLRDFSGLNRFSPEEVIEILHLKNEEISFLKPFARKKKFNGMFGFSLGDLLKINKYDKTEKMRLMDLSNTRLDFKSTDMIVKDKTVDTAYFASAVRKISDDFAENIDNMSVFKINEEYVIKFSTKTPFKSYIVPYVKPSTASKMTESRFKSIQKINEKIDEIKSLNIEVNKHNAEVLTTDKGKLKNYRFSLPSNLIKNEWETGRLEKEDISMLFTDAAGIVSKEDFEYFAKRGFALTPFDTEEIITARKYTFNHDELKTNSAYYKAKEPEILAKEFKKLENIDSGRKIIVVDGLPGAGKSTALQKILKHQKETYYTPDVDAIREYFPEYYQGGIGSGLVHLPASNILKKKILPKALVEGKNIVFQMTGNFEKLDKVLRESHKNGYSIDYINIQTPTNIAISQSNNRHKTNGRFMDPYIILSKARMNSGEKGFMAKILSYNSYIKNSYNYDSGILAKIEEGVDSQYCNLNEKQGLLDRLLAIFNL